MPRRAKTVTDKAKTSRKPLSYADLVEMAGDTEPNIRSALLDYYQSPQGQSELAQSPHKGRPVADVVEDLMKEIVAMKRRNTGAVQV